MQKSTPLRRHAQIDAHVGESSAGPIGMLDLATMNRRENLPAALPSLPRAEVASLLESRSPMHMRGEGTHAHVC